MPAATTNSSTRRGILAAIALASVLVLSTGCTPEMLVGGGTDSEGGNSTTAPDGESGTESSTAAAQECVVGTWYFFEGPELNEFMKATTLGAFNVTTTGFLILSMDPDGNTLTTYDHFVNDVMMESSHSKIERHGDDVGTYSIDSNGVLTVTDTSIDSVTTWVTQTGGETITATDDNPAPSVFTRSEMTCDGEELTVTVDDASAVMYRQH